MKLEITGRAKNPLIGREELRFEVSDCMKTPSRKEIGAKIAALCNAKEESIAVGRITERFGEHRVTGGATIYPSKERMEEIEEKFIINRNLGIRGRQKKAPDKGAAQPAGKNADAAGKGGAEAAVPAAEKKGGQEGKEKSAEQEHAGGGKAETAGAAKEDAVKAGAEGGAKAAEPEPAGGGKAAGAAKGEAAKAGAGKPAEKGEAK